MSQENKVEKGPKKGPQGPAPVQKVEASHCKAEACKKGIEKFGFCKEHYDWYMAGLIRGDGQKPIDFAQKYAQYVAKTAKKAA